MKGVVSKVLEEKHFGFIRGQDGREYFFHKTDLQGFFDDLVEDFSRGGNPYIAVTFEVVPSLKGPRAGNVVRLDGGITATD